MRPIEFVSELRELRFENVFNPYSDQCPVNDLDNAPHHRADALSAILEAACNIEIDSIWVGRDLGYRGGRRTGLALTDDVHLHQHAKRWDIHLDRHTKGPAVAERTASIIWEMLNLIDRPIFLWNVFPLHPHSPGEPFTNRAHNSNERRVGVEVLRVLTEILRPKRVIALGNDAAKALDSLVGINGATKVRHPSYGGQTQFLQQMEELYDVRTPRLL